MLEKRHFGKRHNVPEELASGRRRITFLREAPIRQIHAANPQ